MKARKFYPRQTLRALQGEHMQLNAGQQAALMFAMWRGRKLGLTVVGGAALTSQQAATRDIQNASPFRIRIYGDGKRTDGFTPMSSEALSA